MKIYQYYTPNFLPKQGEILTKEFFTKGLEIGRIDWYNDKLKMERGKLKIISQWREHAMKKLLKPNHLPAAAAGLGGLALVLRRLVYAFAVDEKNLLTGNHPLEIALWVLTAAALGYLVVNVWKLDGSDDYSDNFRPSFAAGVGHVLAAAGILVTVLTNAPRMSGYLGTFWQYLGYLAPVFLVVAGAARVQGRQPNFLLHLIPCLFLVVHIVNHYQLWCGNPQLQDYLFALLGTMALMFFSFYNAAFDVGSGKRRMQMGMGLAAAYLCMAELAVTQYPYLYLGGIAWALTGLCSAYPRPRRQEEA